VTNIFYFLVIAIVLSGCATSYDVQLEKTKVCRIGSGGRIINENQECVDTEAKCMKKGGYWAGEFSHTGFYGCILPTKDAGKSCQTKSDCEGDCIPDKMSAQPSACICGDPKGLVEATSYCTTTGIVSMPIH